MVLAGRTPRADQKAIYIYTAVIWVVVEISVRALVVSEAGVTYNVSRMKHLSGRDNHGFNMSSPY